MGFKSQLQNVQMEIAIMKKLLHNNLIQLHEVIDYDEGDKLYMGMIKSSYRYHNLVLDYAENGEILKWDQKACKFSPFRKD